MTPNSPLTKHDSWEKEFEKRFVPIKPGFSVARDWTKELVGTTANYITIKCYIKDLLQTQREELMEEQNRISNSGRKLYQIGQKELREELIERIEDDGFCMACKRVVVVCEDNPCEIRLAILSLIKEGEGDK